MRLTFEPNTLEMCANFIIMDDNVLEPPEAFTVTATVTEAAFVGGQDSTQVSIGDNDGEQARVKRGCKLEGRPYVYLGGTVYVW